MRIAIEAQRIFRKDKHGMDFVILETLKELQKRKDGNEYYVFVAPGEDWCLEESENQSAQLTLTVSGRIQSIRKRHYFTQLSFVPYPLNPPRPVL